nr:PREDICTED: thioredoxin domain-containing protein 11 isoform X3 [Megachile rotundata]
MLEKEEFEANTPRNGDNSPAIASNSGSNDVAKESYQKSAVEEKLASKMFSYARENICFFLAIIFTALAVLHHSPPKVSKPPSAKPFFNQSSVVLDFYKGHLGAMIEKVTEADFSFVMFYAPWDAESQTVRQEFEAVAEFYHTQAVVVGYFNFTRVDRTPGYREFYKAAIRALERDPNRELVFAIVTSALSSEADYNVYKFPSANLLMWNESLRYPEDSEWTSENILNWIISSTHQPALWLQPPGVKSLTFAPYLKEGPVLFLFTPRNPLHSENYNYNLMKEVGLQYYSCTNNILAKGIIENFILKRRTAITRHSEKNKLCTKLLKESKGLLTKKTVSISMQRWINDSCCANIVMNKCTLCKRSISNSAQKDMSVCKLISDKLDHVCKDTDIFKISSVANLPEKYEICCNKDYETVKDEEGFESKSQKYKMLSTSTEDDVQSSNNVKQSYLKTECKKWMAGNKYHQPVFPRDSSEHQNINLTESVCKINKTLALIAIDSLYYFYFAESFGIDILRKKDKTAVIIVDAAHESQYVMHDDFNRYNLVQFINNYTQGFLQRTLRSNNSRRFLQKFKTKINCEPKDTQSICIPELTTESFSSIVLDTSKDVVVMYYSPYCAFCSAIFYVYLTVAHYFRGMDHLLFVRVDGDNNDLPWEYNMNRFPSILFFPAKRKEDSTVYPFSLPVTISNLVNFVLANLDGDSHVEALVNICQSGAGEIPNVCIARTRWLCLDIIQQLLRDYRKLIRHISLIRRNTKNKKKIILLKLAHIKDIHLILGSTDDLRKDQHKVKFIREKYKKYYELIRSIEVDSKQSVTESTTNSLLRQNVIEKKTIKSEL